MSGIPTYTLDGLGNNQKQKFLLQEFDVFDRMSLNGPVSIGQDLVAEFEDSVKQNLINTRDHLRGYPEQVNHLYDASRFAEIIDYVLLNWSDERARPIALKQASEMANAILQSTAKRDVLGGWFQDRIDGAKDRVDNLFDKINEEFPKVKELADKAGDARDKIVDAAKKAGSAIVQYNPISLAVKGAVLEGMKVNIFKIASRIYIGYFPKADAMKRGIAPQDYDIIKKGLDKLRTIYVDQLKGKESDLKYAIMNPYKRIVKYDKRTLDGLGAAGTAAAATTAATPVWVQVLGILSGLGVAIMKYGPNGKEPFDEGQPDVQDYNGDNQDPNQGYTPEQIAAMQAAAAQAEVERQAAINKENEELESDGLWLALGLPAAAFAIYKIYDHFKN